MAGKKEPSLEERLGELERLAAALENGQMSIDEAIAAYGKGMELVLSCRKSLDEMTQKVTFARQKVQKQLEEADQSKADASLPDDVPF
ncbi:exodeoxyribonuclease VII small subunit [Succinatimonas hippei]|uniref:exodeoxyribonuclease VII small subunit n=1 Tax=Succinatimonas hippei TaxID=626938 RepID=UPI00255CD720|nr:exodeoxyribonuclease VII small subunit [Succinatimonas hippei]